VWCGDGRVSIEGTPLAAADAVDDAATFGCCDPPPGAEAACEAEGGLYDRDHCACLPGDHCPDAPAPEVCNGRDDDCDDVVDPLLAGEEALLNAPWIDPDNIWAGDPVAVVTESGTWVAWEGDLLEGTDHAASTFTPWDGPTVLGPTFAIDLTSGGASVELVDRAGAGTTILFQHEPFGPWDEPQGRASLVRVGDLAACQRDEDRREMVRCAGWVWIGLDWPGGHAPAADGLLVVERGTLRHLDDDGVFSEPTVLWPDVMGFDDPPSTWDVDVEVWGDGHLVGAVRRGVGVVVVAVDAERQPLSEVGVLAAGGSNLQVETSGPTAVVAWTSRNAHGVEARAVVVSAQGEPGPVLDLGDGSVRTTTPMGDRVAVLVASEGAERLVFIGPDGPDGATLPLRDVVALVPAGDEFLAFEVADDDAGWSTLIFGRRGLVCQPGGEVLDAGEACGPENLPCAVGLVCADGECTVRRCGDGHRSGNEACDDGDDDDEDECTSACQVGPGGG